MTPSESVPTSLSSTRFTRSFEKRVLGAIKDGVLIDRGVRVLVAVSGGADSTALLVALSNLKEALEIEIAAAHFDHRLRSRAEAVDDAAFVRRLARVVGAKVQTGAGDVKSRARRERETTEEAARAMRYNFLKRTAKAVGSSVVAAAHNRNDQAETVLMRIIRGTGLDGIAGMRPRAEWPSGRGPLLVRPLLDLPRTDVDRYCRELGIEPRHDHTNDLLIATRNRIRSELLPLLKTFNPSIDRSLARLADSAATDVAALSREADRLFQQDEFTVVQAHSVRFVRGMFTSLPLAWSARLLKRAYVHLTGSPAGLESVHVRSILNSLGKRRGTTSLPAGLVAWTTKDWITIGSERSLSVMELPTKRLRVPGGIHASAWQFDVELLDEAPRPVPRSKLDAYIDERLVKRPLTVRSRRPGDRIRPLGLGGSKKLQDILVDGKVAEEERGNVPIICDRQGPIWIVGHRLDQRVAITESTRRVLWIRASRTDS